MMPRLFRALGGWTLAALVLGIARHRAEVRAEQRHANACHLVDVAKVHRLYSEGEWGP